MYYITLDLEWNQAYYEHAMAVQKRLNLRLRGEVIQIGAVKLDESLRICGSYSILVRPRYFRKLHKHVSSLTGITQEMMDRGVPLPEAAERFRQFCGEDFAFLTWGPDDVPMFKDNLRIHKADGDWLDRTYDLQVIYNQQTDGSSRQRSLEYAMEQMGIPQNLPAHDALNDAYFTALVAQKLDIAAGIAAYDSSQGQYLECSEIGNADAGAVGFSSVEELLALPVFRAPVCPLCGVALTAKNKLLHAKGQRYLQHLQCREHGDMLLSVKLQHNFDGTFRARRLLTEADAEAIGNYERKLAKAEAVRVCRTGRRSRCRKSTARTQESVSPEEVRNT